MQGHRCIALNEINEYSWVKWICSSWTKTNVGWDRTILKTPQTFPPYTHAHTQVCPVKPQNTRCLATIKTLGDMLVTRTPMEKASLSPQTQSGWNKLYTSVHMPCIYNPHENKPVLAAGLVCWGLYVLKQTHAHFLKPRESTNLWNLSFPCIHTDWFQESHFYIF